MKSLHKTFDILEYVVLQNGQSVTPSEAAAALGVNLVTCTRIMGELTDRGYLVKISRKDGYAAGPMVISLGTRDNVYRRIASAAAEPITELSEFLHRQVNIAVLDQSRRIMLCYHLADAELKPWNRFFFTDQWDTATGRLLIAAQDDRSAEKLTASAGVFPFPKEQLDAIRRAGAVRFELNGEIIIGHWVRVSSYPAAAFGFGIAPERADEAFARSAATAERIRNLLMKPNFAY